MREIRTSGLTSGNRKRSHVSPDCGGGTKVSPTTSRTATTTAPVLDSTQVLSTFLALGPPVLGASNLWRRSGLDLDRPLHARSRR